MISRGDLHITVGKAPTVRTIKYPSKTFVTECNEAIDRLEEFVVVVSGVSKKRASLLREAPAITGFQQPEGGFLRSLVDKLRLMSFYPVASYATFNAGYRLSFQDGADLRIHFEPIAIAVLMEK
jgi:hypothetical protein